MVGVFGVCGNKSFFSEALRKIRPGTTEPSLIGLSEEDVNVAPSSDTRGNYR